MTLQYFLWFLQLLSKTDDDDEVRSRQKAPTSCTEKQEKHKVIFFVGSLILDSSQVCHLFSGNVLERIMCPLLCRVINEEDHFFKNRNIDFTLGSKDVH